MKQKAKTFDGETKTNEQGCGGKLHFSKTRQIIYKHL